jgi:uncharacterized caspase-like protein
VTLPDFRSGGAAGFVRRVLTAILLLVGLAVSPAGAAERRVALVIGNGAYAQTPLPNTINDAQAMADVLSRLGFKVTTKLNVTQHEMEYAIIDFGRELQKGGVSLFYYAGHAVQVRGQNFMIPIGAKISVEDHVQPESVDINKVIGRMAGARNKLNIVILDACRDNPFGDTFNFYSEGLAQTRAPAGTYIAYAAAPGEVAFDGTGPHSFYTGALVKALEIRGIPIEETFKHVSAAVREETHKMQTPWTLSSFAGEFYFNPTASEVAEKKDDVIAKELNHDLVFSQLIFDSDRTEDFEDYLTLFPKGITAEKARKRLEELQRQKSADGLRSPTAAVCRLADPAWFGIVDRVIADARAGGADTVSQIQAGVGALTAKRSQCEENERKVAEARKRAAEMAEKRFEKELAKAKQSAAEAGKTAHAKAAQKAERDKKIAIEVGERHAREQAAAAMAKAQEQLDNRAASTMAEAEKKAAAQHRRALAEAKDQATKAYRKAIADAEKAAELMRQSMIEVARNDADKRSQEALSDAKREADEKAAAIVAAAKTEAESQKSRDLAMFQKLAKTTEEKLVGVVHEEAERKYNEAMAAADKAAKIEADRTLAEGRRRAEALRQKQLAAPGSQKPPSPARKDASPSDKELGLGDNVPPELRKRIHEAITDARKKGQGKDGQARAMLEAIKAHRKTATAAKPNAPPSIDIAAANPELKEIIELAMKRAQAEGKDYHGQVRAVVDAVKVYRELENKDGNLTEADK